MNFMSEAYCRSCVHRQTHDCPKANARKKIYPQGAYPWDCILAKENWRDEIAFNCPYSTSCVDIDDYNHDRKTGDAHHGCKCWQKDGTGEFCQYAVREVEIGDYDFRQKCDRYEFDEHAYLSAEVKFVGCNKLTRFIGEKHILFIDDLIQRTKPNDILALGKRWLDEVAVELEPFGYFPSVDGRFWDKRYNMTVLVREKVREQKRREIEWQIKVNAEHAAKRAEKKAAKAAAKKGAEE